VEGKAMISPFSANLLEQICKILGDVATGSEITYFLKQASLQDFDGPQSTKWRRLFNALVHWQNCHQNGKCVLDLIEKMMDPVRFINNKSSFDTFRDDLNSVLAFAGYCVLPSGKVSTTPKAATIDEAQNRSNRLKADLYKRNIHANVLRFCEPEFLQENYFHAVLEATKSVADKLREKSGLPLDGSRLVDSALLGDKPALAINRLSTAAERNEQQGLGLLIKGIFQMFRNVTAHEPKIHKDYEYQEVLDCFTILSYIHKKLDEAFPTGYQQPNT